MTAPSPSSGDDILTLLRADPVIERSIEAALLRHEATEQDRNLIWGAVALAYIVGKCHGIDAVRAETRSSAS